MRKTQSIEVIGIGNFDIYPVKAEEQDFKEVTKEGNPLKKVLVTKGTPNEYKWVSENKDYTKSQVFYDVLGNYTQQVKRTEKVKKFEIVSKAEVYNLTESSFSILNCDETTKNIFDEKVKNNAVKFNIKKSTTGFKWVKAYIYKMKDVLVMVSGLGDVEKAIKEFNKISNTQQNIDVIIQKVEMKADELEIQI
jgi:hypothetical protein